MVNETKLSRVSKRMCEGYLRFLHILFLVLAFAKNEKYITYVHIHALDPEPVCREADII
jgi:hypothetical protein